MWENDFLVISIFLEMTWKTVKKKLWQGSLIWIKFRKKCDEWAHAVQDAVTATCRCYCCIYITITIASWIINKPMAPSVPFILNSRWYLPRWTQRNLDQEAEKCIGILQCVHFWIGLLAICIDKITFCLACWWLPFSTRY